MSDQHRRNARAVKAVAHKTTALSGCLLLAALLVSFLPLAAGVRAQPVSIPLEYKNTGVWRLSINVGVNGAAPQAYLFDTGSTNFNAALSPGFNPSPSTSIGTNQTCYGITSITCYYGFTVRTPTLDFYAPGAGTGSTPVLTLSTIPSGSSTAAPNTGYVMNALQNVTDGSGKVIETYSSTKTAPSIQGFYGIFGAGNFSGQKTGSVLGQTIRPNVQHQGYVVSANGQPNPAAAVNPPYGGNSIVTVGGVQQQVNPTCVACVTVGLTSAVMGQFGPVNSVVPWDGSGPSFPNPYGTGPGNNGGLESGTHFTTTLTNGGSVVTATAKTLLDSGTWDFVLTDKMQGGSTAAGTTISLTGVTPLEAPIVGLPTMNATLTGTGADLTYQVERYGKTNTVGIGFFMQNSVMHDLTGQVLGYTPFYVTPADLVTVSNGPLIIGSNNVPLGIAGVISGAGGVTINSGGAAQLSATNTYTGQTTIAAASGATQAGRLLISGPGSIASSSGVVNNGVFDVSGAWSPVGIQSLSGGGRVNLGGQNLSINSGGNFSGIIADGGFYSGSGGSLTLTGGGLIFSGTGTFTGGTLVTGGTFALTGTLASPVSVQPGGNFINQGTISSSFANAGSTTNNGTIAGNVVNTGSFAHNGLVSGSFANAGTLSGSGVIGGNYGHFGNAVHQVGVNGSGQSDLVRVGGTAVIQGGAVGVVAVPGGTFAPRTTYRILTAAGGVAGTYASVVDPYPFLLPSLSYDPNNVYLTVQMGGFAAAAANPNQSAVGRVLDANINTASGDFAQVLSAMASNTQSISLAQATLTALSGQNYSTFSSTMVQGAYLFMNNFANQIGGGGSPASNRVALAEACDIACDVTPPAVWGAWGGALGGLGTIGANTGTGAVTYNVGGFAAGLDRLVAPGLRVGVTTGYTTGTQWTSGFTGTGMTDTFLAGLYGGYRMDKVYADAVFGYAYSYNQMWRQIFIPGLQQRTAQGRTGANQWYGQIEGGYRFDIGTAADAYITPFMRWQGYTGNQNGFSESGAQSLNLTVAGQTTNSLRSVIGAQLGGAIDLGWREKLALQFRLGWSHEYASTARPVTATLAGAPLMPFTTYGIAPTRDGAVVGFSANTAIADGTSMYLRYEGNISGSDSAHALTAGVRMSW